MPNLPTYVQTLSSGTSVYTEATSATPSTADAQAVLAAWEKDTHQGDGTGTDNAGIVEQGASANGQTSFYVTPNQMPNTATGTGNEGVPTTSQNYSQMPGFNNVTGNLAAGNVAGAQQSFADMLNDSWMNNPNLDINGLVQAVMRNSYEDNQQDLKYYALKVQFYNNLKKAIRSELGRARDWQSTHELSGPNASNSNLTQAYTPGPQYSTHPPASGSEVQTQDQAMAAASSTSSGMSGTSSAGLSSGTGTTMATGAAGTTAAGTTAAGTGAAGTTAAATSATATTGPALSGQGVTPVAASTVAFQPPLGGDPSQWQVYKTQDSHYIAVNFNQHDKGAGEVRVYQPGANGQPGALSDQVWGDPHMNTSQNLYSSASGKDGHGFNQYGQFGVVLNDGTTISMASSSSVGGTAAISSVDIASGSDHYQVTSGANQTGTQASANMNDGANYINQNVIGNSSNDNLFALKDSAGGAPSEVDVYRGGTWQKVADQNNIAGTGGAGSTLQTSGNASVSAGQQGVAQAQGNQITTANQLDSYIQSQEDLLQSVGDDAQLAQVDLQNMSQKQQQTLQTLSNLSKSFHDLSMAIIRNISG